MLINLLRVHLRPYWGTISAIVALQLVQTLATLYLPNMNADIIDNGVAVGGTGHIVRVGGLMLVVTLVQITAAICAGYLEGSTAKGWWAGLLSAVLSSET